MKYNYIMEQQVVGNVHTGLYTPKALETPESISAESGKKVDADKEIVVTINGIDYKGDTLARNIMSDTIVMDMSYPIQSIVLQGNVTTIADVKEVHKQATEQALAILNG